MSDEKKKTLSNEEITTTNMGRRGTFGVLGAGVLAASVAAVGVTSTAKAIPNCTDRDPQDPAGNGRGRGISDSDPRDPAAPPRARVGHSASRPFLLLFPRP